MKRILGILVFITFFVGVCSAGNLTEIYAKVVSIDKIISHQKGYKVTYFTGHGDLHSIYIPIEWFYQSGKYKTSDGFIKAEIVKGNGPQYPYMQIFWENGKFHHIRLFVFSRVSHRSWGVLNDTEQAQMAKMFDPAKDLDLAF